jgi:hypothetical protein
VQGVACSGALMSLIEFIILEVILRFVKKKKCHFDDALEFSRFFIGEMESLCCFDAQAADPCFRVCEE